MVKATAFVFARGGSKGLPGKNIRSLCGKPLIGWAIEQALQAQGIARVIVSTDSIEIADVARRHGAEVPFLRPAELAQDRTPEWMAWRHALETLVTLEGVLPELMVSVPCTSPLRISQDIEKCLAEYINHKCDAVITVSEAHRSPYFNMIKKTENGHCRIIMQSHSNVLRRQDSPLVFDITTVAYVVNPQFVLTHGGLFEGLVRYVVIPKERALDIDDSMDFRIAEMLMRERLELA